MCPRRVTHELIQEQRSGDRPCFAAHVLHVGDVGVECRAILALERQLPQLLVGARRSGEQLIDDLLVVADHTGHAVTECTRHRSGEGGDVDDAVGLLFGGERQTVGEDQATFGIGVVDLDRLAVANGEHVAHGHGAARREIVGAHQIRSHLVGATEVLQGAHRGQHGSGTAHVALHHRVRCIRRLERDTTRVVHHAFADEDQVRLRSRLRCTLRAVGQLDHARWLRTTAVDTHETATTHGNQLVLVEHLHLEAARSGDLDGLVGEDPSSEVRGWHVGEIAGHVGGLGDHVTASDAGCNACTRCANQGDRLQLRCRLVDRLQCGVAMRDERDSLHHDLCSKFAIETTRLREARGRTRVARCRTPERGSTLAQ